MASLYEISKSYQSAFLEIIDMDLDDQTLQDTLDSISSDLEEKSRNIAALFQNLESDVEQMKAAENRIKARRIAKENKVARLKKYLLDNMIDCGIKKIECPEFSIAVRAGAKDSVVEYTGDPELLPKDLRKVTYTADKNAIKLKLKSGEKVDDAKLVDGKPSLLVK